MNKIFISYSRTDITVAQSVSKTAEQQGYKSLVDFSTLSVDGNFAKQVTTFIKECDFVLFIASKTSLDSQWNRREVEFAIQQGKSIIPMLYNVSKAEVRTTWLYNCIQKTDWIIYDNCGKTNLIRFLSECQEPTSCEGATKNRHKHYTQAYAPKKSNSWCKIGCLCIFLAILVFIFTWSLFRVGSPNMSAPVDEDICSAPPQSINTSHGSIYSDTIIVDESNEYEQTSSDSFEKNEISISKGSPGFDKGIIILVLLLALATTLSYRFKFRRISIKFVADEDCEVYADNNKITMLSANKVISIKLKKGTYYITFKPINKNIQEKSLSYSVKLSNDLINMAFDKSKGCSNHRTIKCFIAGSTKLESERDALRAAIAQTHNHWAGKNVEILSYTYEDFERKVVDGGHQQLYDDFITNEASITVFIISGEIGEFTITEFDKALNAYKSGKHPQILVFNDEHAVYHEQAESLKRMVIAEKQYWVDYDSLKTLKLQFMSTLDWLIIDSRYN